jgi:glucose/arabinose dehydrogenase
LLGIAFHPNYRTNGKFYIACSQPLRGDAPLDCKLWWAHTNVVSEMTVSKDNLNKANASVEKIIHSLDWPQFNHNGHWMEFGPDGKLYLSTGDGGYANDWGIGHNVTTGNGQDLKSEHAKMLRLDVDKDDYIPADNPFVGAQRRRAADLGVRPAQSLALLVRHGRRARAILRRRATGLLRGGEYHHPGRQLRLAPHGS